MGKEPEGVLTKDEITEILSTFYWSLPYIILPLYFIPKPHLAFLF